MMSISGSKSKNDDRRLISEILEDIDYFHLLALQIDKIQVEIENFVYEFRDINKTGCPIDWDTVELMGIPIDFFSLCLHISEMEVRL